MHRSMPSGLCWLLQIARILWCIWQRHRRSSTSLIPKTYSDKVALIRCTFSISILEWSMKNYQAPWRSSSGHSNQNSHQELRQNFFEGWSYPSYKSQRQKVSSPRALLLDPFFFLAPGFLPDSEAHFPRLHPDKWLKLNGQIWSSLYRPALLMGICHLFWSHSHPLGAL